MSVTTVHVRVSRALELMETSGVVRVALGFVTPVSIAAKLRRSPVFELVAAMI